MPLEQFDDELSLLGERPHVGIHRSILIDFFMARTIAASPVFRDDGIGHQDEEWTRHQCRHGPENESDTGRVGAASTTELWNFTASWPTSTGSSVRAMSRLISTSRGAHPGRSV